MADNVEFQASLTATPAKGENVAAHEIGGVKYQRIKLVSGATPDDISADAPLHVTDRVPYALFYYDGSGNLEYRCTNTVHGTAASATSWEITKYAYGAKGITSIQTLTGSVTGRAALGWV
jgi:hypothetical protein